jgi:hypothetical protein
VKIIVPFPGGGINDVLARILAEDPIHFDIRHRQCGH